METLPSTTWQMLEQRISDKIEEEMVLSFQQGIPYKNHVRETTPNLPKSYGYGVDGNKHPHQRTMGRLAEKKPARTTGEYK